MCLVLCRMLLGLQPPRYVVHPHYAEKLKQLLQLTNDMEGGLPLEYDVTTLQVRGTAVTGSQYRRLPQARRSAACCAQAALCCAE